MRGLPAFFITKMALEGLQFLLSIHDIEIFVFRNNRRLSYKKPCSCTAAFARVTDGLRHGPNRAFHVSTHGA